MDMVLDDRWHQGAGSAPARRCWKPPVRRNIHIPTLCYLKGRQPDRRLPYVPGGGKGARALQAACVMPVSEGMEVNTNTPAIRDARKVNLELILSNHDRELPDLRAQPATASCRPWPRSWASEISPSRACRLNGPRCVLSLPRPRSQQVHSVPPLRRRLRRMCRRSASSAPRTAASTPSSSPRLT